MKFKPRARTLFILLLPVLVLAALLATDPDGGASTGIWALRLLTAVLAVTLAHWARKAMFDYPEADMQSLFRKAREGNTGAGLALVAQAIVIFALVFLFGGQVRAQDVRTYIPAGAHTYLLTLKVEQHQNWRDHPRPAVLAALVEHESCISLTHSRCWNPASRLKSAREEGAGLGQITRAYRADGSLRFDALAELVERHPALSELGWDNVYSRPDLQLRAVVLKSRDNHRFFSQFVRDPLAALEFADAGYNGGNGGVQAERRACGLVAGCDPQRWFGHVERHCLKSPAALYGQRSACDINRHHVTDVLLTRTPKYAKVML